MDLLSLPWETTQHLTAHPNYHSVPHPLCTEAHSGLCWDQENPAPTQATCHIHDGALAVLPHTETFIETVLSVLTYSLLLESDMDS